MLVCEEKLGVEDKVLIKFTSLEIFACTFNIGFMLPQRFQGAAERGNSARLVQLHVGSW